MKWENPQAKDKDWHRPITNRPKKAGAAQKLASLLKDGDIIGAGSGSTSYLTLKALARRRDKEHIYFCVIPTSTEIELMCTALSIPTTSLKKERPDWSFDGADEVDPNNNLIKGRGGALLREKLVIAASPKVYIVVDDSKYVKRLGQNFPVPVEVIPEAIQLVEQSLLRFPGATEVRLRQAVAKDGPVFTENGNVIFDVWFDKILPGTEKKLKSIVGVIESGLFMGYKLEVI